MATSETPPNNLPDPAMLARLANEFFSALPLATSVSSPLAAPSSGLGGVPLPANPHPAGLSLPPGAFGHSTPSAVPAGAIPPGANLVPTSPQTAANAGASAPSLLPHAVAPNGVPDHALMAGPAFDGRAGSQLVGVHSVPSVPLTQSSEPINRERATVSPYYFLNESVAPPLSLKGAELSPPERFTVPSLSLEKDHANGAAPSPSFYFLNLNSSGPKALEREPAVARPALDVNVIRRDFPILQERVNGRPLVWFDNAATTQKPQAVIDRLAHFYAHENSNIHRAAHELAARATDAYEGARQTIRRFIGAGSVEEIIFVRGTTEAINLVAKTWGAKNIGPGDEIVVSHLEHHANIVPWQQLASEKGARIRVIPVDDSGQVLLDEYKRLLNDRTKIVSVTQVSNALGTVVPVKEIIDIAHQAGILTLVDGAQSVSHMRVNVRELDADFFVFSGHKIFGPTGIGVLYGKREVLESMPPWQGGGNMISDVTFERTIYHGPPARFEAGTGNIADAVGLAAALDYVERIGIENIGLYEHSLLEYATAHMQSIPGVRLIGTAKDKASVLSFVLKGYSTEEVGQALNKEGIAVRTGHHCAQPILRRFGVETTVRPSLAFYNTCEEIDRMVKVVRRLAAASR